MSDFLDFEDITVKPKFKEKYKGVPGETHRIAIIWPKEEKQGPFVMRNVHYEGKYFICKEGGCPACDKIGPSRQRLASLIIKYKTKKDGTIIRREGEATPFDYEVMEWVFYDKKFNQLKTLHNEWDLKNHDFLVKCEGSEQYQDLTFTPCKESLWQLKPEFKDEIYKESEPSRSKLVNAVGNDLSTDEIKELLGLGVAKPSEVISNEDELNSILAEV